MIRIYLAENIIEANFIKDILESHMIVAKILNQNAIGAVGEIPVNQVYPEVWIHDESRREMARDLIKDLNKTETSIDIFCSRCSEKNPGNFEICWNCGSLI